MAVTNSKFSEFVNGGDLAVDDIVVGLRAGLNTRFTYTGELPSGVIVPVANGGTGLNAAVAVSYTHLFPEAYYTTPTSHIYTVTGSQVTSVAPGWDLVTSGAGTVTVSRVANTSIAPNDPAVVSVNPPVSYTHLWQ